MFQDLLNQLSTLAGENLLNLLIALGILIGGWIVARVVAYLVRRILRRTNLVERLSRTVDESEAEATSRRIEGWVGAGVFWLIMLFVLVAFFQTLQLTAIATPLSNLLDEILIALPNVIGAALILLAAWLIASLVKMIVLRALEATRFEERISETTETEADEAPVSESLATGIFWLVFLLFLPAVLNSLGMQGLVLPVQGVVDDALGAIPNIFGAAIILVVGWFLARILRQVVTNLLAATRVDALGARVGLSTDAGAQPLSQLLGTITYVLVLIPAVIAALNALEISALSEPAISMLTTVLNGIPAFFGALLLLGLAYFAGKLVSNLVTSLLSGVGFDNLPERLGLRMEREEGQPTLSEVAGLLVLVGIMLLAATEAANMLGLETLASMIASFTTLGGQVLLALVILVIGLYLANLARSVVLSASGTNATFLANLARIAILVFVVALALEQLGIASETVNLAFGILLGAIGVAVALAFGLGARDVAGRQVERWARELGVEDERE